MQPKFKKGYYPNLLSWKEFVTLINIRPLMRCDRIVIPKFKEEHYWENSSWTLDQKCSPPLLLKHIFQNNICYLKDMSRCSRKVNDLAKRLYTDDNTPLSDEDFIDLEWEYKYDEEGSTIDNDNFINNSETNWKTIETALEDV